ncbi:type IV secretory system conjugative DNA transfer family protein, partial [Anaerotruncus colihominis]|uniref:type IV secretory system conjugative DNA transfer family protein n=2 Tax=Anaerotruncus colihominis TaxID=169435 RepID=UPI001FA9038D
DDLRARAKMEKYAKICAKTIIQAGGEQNYGQNAYFYDAAEGLLASVMMLIAEFCPPEERHIVSVFKLLQDLLAPSKVKGKNHFQLLMEQLPPEHKARWMAGAALHTGEQAMLSVLSTAMSRLNAFLDTELEQLLCFDSAIDAERFCKEKTALFIVMPEEDPTAYFLVSLIIQQLYRELMTVADENGGKLPRRCIFYADEFGTIPKLEGAEMMFSAARSRGLTIVAIVQGLVQLDKNYGGEGAQVIRDNCQLTIFGGFAPGSETAETLSKDLGEQTVLSGSVSKGKDNNSRSLQMMGRRLMTPDELKSMPKGQFITMKTGMHPMKTKFSLFLNWGIRFGKQYELPEHSTRKIQYAGREKLAAAIAHRYPKAKPKQEVAPAVELAGEPVQEALEKPPHRRPPRTD